MAPYFQRWYFSQNLQCISQSMKTFQETRERKHWNAIKIYIQRLKVRLHSKPNMTYNKKLLIDLLSIKTMCQNSLKRARMNFACLGTQSLICVCRYDYILRVETMSEDARLILPLLGQHSSALSSATSNVAGAHHATWRAKVGKKTHDILNEISMRDKKRLKEYYKKELSLFGYDFNSLTNTVSCRIKRENSTCC